MIGTALKINIKKSVLSTIGISLIFLVPIYIYSEYFLLNSSNKCTYKNDY